MRRNLSKMTLSWSGVFVFYTFLLSNMSLAIPTQEVVCRIQQKNFLLVADFRKDRNSSVLCDSGDKIGKVSPIGFKIPVDSNFLSNIQTDKIRQVCQYTVAKCVENNKIWIAQEFQKMATAAKSNCNFIDTIKNAEEYAATVCSDPKIYFQQFEGAQTLQNVDLTNHVKISVIGNSNRSGSQ